MRLTVNAPPPPAHPAHPHDAIDLGSSFEDGDDLGDDLDTGELLPGQGADPARSVPGQGDRPERSRRTPGGIG